ncbi:hypothetical protein QBC39DRAFT_360336 [Podospora conica]|nr:hypothetical protein QBC39DRAFT_360336 [Schizothecium conicum]
MPVMVPWLALHQFLTCQPRTFYPKFQKIPARAHLVTHAASGPGPSPPTNGPTSASPTMCGGNDEETVCRSSIAHLRLPGTRIEFGPACSRAMWQHVIRYRLSARDCSDPPDREQLAAAMFLVRPDGTSWGAGWDCIVWPRVKSSLERKTRELVAKGLVKEGGIPGQRQWVDWSRGFTNPAWDGCSFKEAYGRKLLDGIIRQQGQQQQDPELLELGPVSRPPSPETRPQLRPEPQLGPESPPLEPEPEPVPGIGAEGLPGPDPRHPEPEAEPERRRHGPPSSAPDREEIEIEELQRQIRELGHEPVVPPRFKPPGQPPHARPGPSSSLTFASSRSSDAAYWATQSPHDLRQRVREIAVNLILFRQIRLIYMLKFGDDLDGPQNSVEGSDAFLAKIEMLRLTSIEEVVFLEDLLDERYRQCFGHEHDTAGYALGGRVWKIFFVGDVVPQILLDREEKGMEEGMRILEAAGRPLDDLSADAKPRACT